MSDSIDRRKVTKGLAWSVPTVVAAAAAPFAAASPITCDREALWREWASTTSMFSIDADGVITFRQPADWNGGSWTPRTLMAMYGDTGSEQFQGVPGKEEGTLVLTPPTGADPFDIRYLTATGQGDPRPPEDDPDGDPVPDIRTWGATPNWGENGEALCEVVPFGSVVS